MALPDIGQLHINGVLSRPSAPHAHLPQDIVDTNGSREMEKLKNLARLLPYSVEPDSRMQQMLDFIMRRIYQAVEAQDYDIGFLQWDTMLALFVSLLFFPSR
jgi:proteasome activator subunit 4